MGWATFWAIFAGHLAIFFKQTSGHPYFIKLCCSALNLGAT
jgi:hypothetical protein